MQDRMHSCRRCCLHSDVDAITFQSYPPHKRVVVIGQNSVDTQTAWLSGASSEGQTYVSSAGTRRLSNACAGFVRPRCGMRLHYV